MKKALIAFTAFLFSLPLLHAQVTYRTTSTRAVKAGVVRVDTIREDWMPHVKHYDIPHPDGESVRDDLQKLKELMREKYPYKTPSQKVVKRDASEGLIKLRDFDGNTFTNSPNDNEVAISKDGKLISVVNTTIMMYDVQTDTMLKFVSLVAFNQTGSTGKICYDPKVYYDPEQDRFILLWLFGAVQPNQIHLAFSQTNDPLGNWNYYIINGNPYGNNTWSDYPMIASTTKELFLTVNLVFGSDWKNGFRGTLIHQIDKQSGYAGDSVLKSVLIDSINFNGGLLRNICPVKGGSRSYGPNLYFLSNRNFAATNDTVFLLEWTDTIDAPGAELKMAALKASPSYFLSPSARQKRGKNFDTNDSRVLGAFLENGKIQYVHNSMDTSTGFPAVYHGVIEDVAGSPYINGHIIGDTALELGYPNISYAGKSATDHSSVISFDHTGLQDFSGTSAVCYNRDGNYSPILRVKNGDSIVAIVPFYVSMERWGDYTGSQRKYDEPGKVWITGYYADTLQRNRSWVAELVVPSGVGIMETSSVKKRSLIYPNPSADMVSVEFDLPQEEELTFSIYNLHGVLMKEILQHRCKTGINTFTFSTQPLAPGVYFLKAKGEKGERFTEKIIRH